MKIIVSALVLSVFCNLILYHFYDSTSSDLLIARQDISSLEAMQSSLQKQLEDAYSLREIEAKTSVEWKDEQGSLEDKKDVLIDKITSNETACTQRNETNVSTQTNYVSLDDKLPVDVVSVLSEAASDLQK
ncbi:hypothetical protein D3C85_1035100 [compost metagenome]